MRLRTAINPDQSILELIKTCEAISALAERDPLARRLGTELVDLIEQAFKSGLNTTSVRAKAFAASTDQIELRVGVKFSERLCEIVTAARTGNLDILLKDI
jgi:hypothetical protein